MPRRTLLLALGLALAVTLPSLRLGWVLDDHVIGQVTKAQLAEGRAPLWTLFDIVGRAPGEAALRIRNGTLPWWSSPELSISFFRPLAAATHGLDYLLWPRHAEPMHAQNMLWYGLLVVLVGLLYGRLLPAKTAALALLLYAIDDAHACGVAWIASRNTLVSSTLAAATLLLHLRARQERWTPGAFLAPLVLAFALCAGEGAVAVWGYLLPYALFLDRGSAQERARALAPMLAITLLWLVIYRAAGYGAHDSGVYRDPFDAPLAFFGERVPRVLPEILREQLAVPSWAGQLVPALAHPLVSWLLGVLALAGLVLLLRLARSRKELGFWLGSLVLAALPVCGISGIAIMPRLLFVTGLAGFALVAELIVTLWTRAKEHGPLLRGSARAVALACFVLHGPLALALAPRAHTPLIEFETLFRESARRMPAELAPGSFVYVLNTPNYFVTSMAAFYRPAEAPPIVLQVLGASHEPVRLTRDAERAFVLEPKNGYLLEPYSQLVRAPSLRFTRGQTIAAGELQVTVEQVTPDGRPEKVRFVFPKHAARERVFVTWRDGGYERVHLPAVGGSVTLPPG